MGAPRGVRGGSWGPPPPIGAPRTRFRRRFGPSFVPVPVLQGFYRKLGSVGPGRWGKGLYPLMWTLRTRFRRRFGPSFVPVPVLRGFYAYGAVPGGVGGFEGRPPLMSTPRTPWDWIQSLTPTLRGLNGVSLLLAR